MITLKENIIHLTRGDETNEYNNIPIKFSYVDELGINKDYEFKPTDRITIIVFEKKGYTKKEIINKTQIVSELGYTEPTSTINIKLTTNDTNKFPLKNKKQTFWYDIILNDETTILGYDESGAKKIIVYPGTKD